VPLAEDSLENAFADQYLKSSPGSGIQPNLTNFLPLLIALLSIKGIISLVVADLFFTRNPVARAAKMNAA